MDIFLTGLALPFLFGGLATLNDNGAYAGKHRQQLLGWLLVTLGLVFWCVAMGSLRGFFAYLGLLTLVGIYVTYRFRVRTLNARVE